MSCTGKQRGGGARGGVAQPSGKREATSGDLLRVSNKAVLLIPFCLLLGATFQRVHSSVGKRGCYLQTLENPITASPAECPHRPIWKTSSRDGELIETGGSVLCPGLALMLVSRGSCWYQLLTKAAGLPRGRGPMADKRQAKNLRPLRTNGDIWKRVKSGGLRGMYQSHLEGPSSPGNVLIQSLSITLFGILAKFSAILFKLFNASEA